MSETWQSLPPDAIAYFDEYIVAPVRRQVDSLDAIRDSFGWRYAWESAIGLRAPSTDPLTLWSETAREEGCEPERLIQSHGDYQTLLAKLRTYKEWGDSDELQRASV